MSLMKDIALHNAEQLGASIRLKRREKGLSQLELAASLGVGRKWVINLEAGNPKAELGLVLRALKVLDLRANLSDVGAAARAGSPASGSRLDEVFRRLERPGRK
jgi:HTH-type transcriptional regulator/antitoxin HipB